MLLIGLHKSVCYGFFFPIIFSLLTFSSASAQPNFGMSQDQANFAKIFFLISYTEWPHTNYQTTLKICIATDDPYRSRIKNWLDNRNIRGRSTSVINLPPSSFEDIDCQVVIFGNKSSLTKTIINRIKNKPILTIGITENITKYGGVVWMRRQARKGLVPYIKLKSLRNTSLKIHPELLKLSCPKNTRSFDDCVRKQE